MKIEKRVNSITIRYSLILLISIFSGILTLVLTPLTVYASYFILKLFYNASIYSNVISFNGKEIELIEACISTLAYLLLIVLNLSLEMPLMTRIKALSASLAAFFAFNILRISLLAGLFVSNSFLFTPLHVFLWYIGSLIVVFLIWVFAIRHCKIKEIPLISDMRYLLKKI